MLYLLNSLSKTSIFLELLIVLTFHVAIFNCFRLFSFITSRVSFNPDLHPQHQGSSFPSDLGQSRHEVSYFHWAKIWIVLTSPQ